MPRASRVRGRYTPQACDPCRLRRTKCSGDRPICSSCAAGNKDCKWDDNPKRPSNTRRLKARERDLEVYVNTLEARLDRCRVEHADHDSSYLNLRPEMPTLSDEGDDASSNSSDEVSNSEGLRALKLERHDLQLYGPTSIFQFAHKPLGRRFPDIVENPDLRYVLLGHGSDPSHYNPDFDWCRHLPSEVHLTRQEHDKVLDLLFKFFTSWCLGIVPDLFLRDMYRALCRHRSQTPLKTTHYSPMLHNSLVALATAFSDNPSIRDIKSRMCYATAAKNYIDDECQSPSLSAVHALSLLGAFHSSQGNQTLGYMYVGMSGRISQALGLSIDASPWVEAGLITQDDMLDRNWTHWTTFSMDVCWSLFVGREFCVSSPSDHDSDTIPIPFVDTDFDQIPWHYPPSGIPSQPGFLSRTFAKTCELLRIARGIMDVLNVLNSPITRRNVDHDLISQIDARLHTWKAELSEEVDMTEASQPTATPHRLMLHLTYWQLFILLHRPFYRRSRPSTGIENDVDHAMLCNTAAQHIMALAHTWKSLYTLRYVPITLIQVIFSAGTIFLLSAVQATSRSEPISDLLSQAEQCSRYLNEIGQSWHCAKRVATILSTLLQEQWKPKLSRSASQNRQNRQNHASTLRRLFDQAVSPTPIITLHDYEMGTSPVSPLSDQTQSDWPSTSVDPLMGGGSQTGGPFVSSWTTINERVRAAGMNRAFKPCTSMASDLGSPMGLGMSTGETPTFMPLGLPSSSNTSGFPQDYLPFWQMLQPQQRHYAPDR